MASDPRQPVRVLQVVRPAVGGMKGHVLRLACGLRAFGFDSEIACPGDSELVRDALESKIIVSALRRTMGDAGRERAVSEFGEARMLERIADVYQEVLA